MTPDVNVLVSAERRDHPHHRIAREWLETALVEASVNRSLLLLPMVVARYLRLVTNRRVFVEPTTPARAIDFIDALLPRRRDADTGP